MTASLLFESIAIGQARMRNRVALAPMTTCFADRDGFVTNRQVAFLARRAEGGAGLVMTEGAAVHPLGRGWEHHFSIYHDHHLPGLRRLATAIHAHGALAWVQLMHNGRRTVSEVIGAQPVSATGRRSTGRAWEIPRRLSTNEVHEVVGYFVDAARRAADGGFDGVELHGGHAYLINQFLSPAKNDRDDEFGGDLEARARFVTEIVRRTHEALPGFPVGVRLSVVEFEPGGITLEETQHLVKILERAGAAYIDGSAGVSTLTKELRWTAGTGEATLSEYAAQVRPCLQQIPYMTIGRILRPETAELELAAGHADIIGLGRALIADPDWVRKAEGRAPFMICIGCNACQQRSSHRQSGCPVNPDVGREQVPAPAPVRRRRRVLVVGSGVGGIELARMAARRGNRVIVAPLGRPLGGLLGLRARVPGNEELAVAVAELVRRLRDDGVTISDAATVAAAMADAGPAVVVDARAGEERVLPLPWRSVGLEAALLDKGADSLVGRVAVVGSVFATLEVANSLAYHGHEVTVLSDLERPGHDTHPQLTYRALERLAAAGGRVEGSVSYSKLVSLARGHQPHDFRDRFDGAVVALGWRETIPDVAADPVVGSCEYHALGDEYNPWELRFVVERGIELAQAL